MSWIAANYHWQELEDAKRSGNKKRIAAAQKQYDAFLDAEKKRRAGLEESPKSYRSIESRVKTIEQHLGLVDDDDDS